MNIKDKLGGIVLIAVAVGIGPVSLGSTKSENPPEYKIIIEQVDFYSHILPTGGFSKKYLQTGDVIELIALESKIETWVAQGYEAAHFSGCPIGDGDILYTVIMRR